MSNEQRQLERDLEDAKREIARLQHVIGAPGAPPHARERELLLALLRKTIYRCGHIDTGPRLSDWTFCRSFAIYTNSRCEAHRDTHDMAAQPGRTTEAPNYGQPHAYVAQLQVTLDALGLGPDGEPSPPEPRVETRSADLLLAEARLLLRQAVACDEPCLFFETREARRIKQWLDRNP